MNLLLLLLLRARDAAAVVPLPSAVGGQHAVVSMWCARTLNITAERGSDLAPGRTNGASLASSGLLLHDPIDLPLDRPCPLAAAGPRALTRPLAL